MIKKVAVGLSGGVDSSVAAFLLKQQGWDVTGVYLQCWEKDTEGCSSDKDKQSALEVVSKLDIGFEYLNFIQQYKERVIDYFYQEYEAGRTPNPDILCNTEIKFGLFLDWAMKQGFEYIATGHYARVQRISSKMVAGDFTYNLLAGVDHAKDQSYFLYRLNQKQLSKVVFPLGELTKPYVREIAKNAGLPTYNRPDSMGICFVGEVDIKDFLKKRISLHSGEVITVDGEVVGDHDGITFYTIGQRHGFRLSKYFGLPVYVIGKNVEKNQLIVGFVKDVTKHEFFVDNIHWIVQEPLLPLNCLVRVRHLGTMYQGTVTKDMRIGDNIQPGQSIANNTYKVVVTPSIFGVAPGQSAVFYDGDIVLGGGVILSA